MIILVILLVLLYYFYNKNQLYQLKITELFYDNKLLVNKIQDLQDYKSDMSKTLSVLDNDLGAINNHIKSSLYNNSITTIAHIDSSPTSSTHIDNITDNVKVLDSSLLETLFEEHPVDLQGPDDYYDQLKIN